jgi:hypothetical protein
VVGVSYYADPLVTLLHGDCIEVMAELEADSVDAVVTDPPYGLEFMGKEWDSLDHGLPQENVWKGRRGKGGANVGTDDSKPGSRHHVGYGGSKAGFKRCQKCGKRAFSGSPCKCPEPEWVVEYNPGAPSSAIRMQRWHEQWALEALRVTKPGGYLLAFGGTRTHHRLVCALEDAGWIIRDELDWIYASGFPKGKANLKPAHEPIVLARKPGPLRRIGTDGGTAWVSEGDKGDDGQFGGGIKDGGIATLNAGRWPSNVLLSDPELFDEPNPEIVGSGATSDSGEPHQVRRRATSLYEGGWASTDEGFAPGGSGGYSRFFIVPKSDRAERERGLDRLYCNCKTVKPERWESQDRKQHATTATTSPRKATSEGLTKADTGSSMTLFGSSTSEPSPQETRSTTSTGTSSTTESRTLSPSIPLPTNGSTLGASSSTASGGSDAPSAPSTDPSTLSGGTSRRKAGRSTAGADPATSPESSPTRNCADCGRVVKPQSGSPTEAGDGVAGARRNSHPT